MATNLKRVNLMLDEALTDRLREEARRRRVSMSELARSFLARDLGLDKDLRPALERIRRLRDAVGPMPDSTAVVRESRDRDC